jgi:hypothetical protein
MWFLGRSDLHNHSTCRRWINNSLQRLRLDLLAPHQVVRIDAVELRNVDALQRARDVYHHLRWLDVAPSMVFPVEVKLDHPRNNT